MDPDMTLVSSSVLEELAEAVERASFLNREASDSASQLLDPSCMLEALSDVYTASLQLVRESIRPAHSVPIDPPV